MHAGGNLILYVHPSRAPDLPQLSSGALTPYRFDYVLQLSNNVIGEDAEELSRAEHMKMIFTNPLHRYYDRTPEIYAIAVVRAMRFV